MTDTEYTIRKCERGFLVNNDAYRTGLAGKLWAFDTVEDAAKWLVEQWATVSPYTNVAYQSGLNTDEKYSVKTEGY